MVSISRKTAKSSTSLRSSRMMRYYEKEKMGLASLALTVGTLCAYWLFLTRNDTTTPADVNKAAPPLLRPLPDPAAAAAAIPNTNNKQQRRLPELPTRYNGIAKDILQVLNCSQKLPTYYSWNDEMPGFRDDEVNAYEKGKGGGDGGSGGGAGGGGMSGAGGGLYQVREQAAPKMTTTTTTTTTSASDSKLARDWMNGAGDEEEKSAAAQGAIKDERLRRRRLTTAGAADPRPPAAPGGTNSYTSTYDINAKHLFCLAAGAPDLPKTVTSNSFKCPVLQTSTRQALLDAWSAARAAAMSEPVLRKVLDVTVETSRDVLGHAVKLWAPTADDGSDYVIKRLGKNVDDGGIKGLEDNLGPGKVFVDVGSCLGLTALAVTLQYPGTTVVAIEPASPNWLIMQMNFICNLEDDAQRPHVVLGGVGESTSPNRNNNLDSQMAKMIWRSSSTTMTRAWTPGKDRKATDLELVVALRRWDSILKDANVERRDIDVLNVDCQGCEYNLIPSLSNEEYEDISTVMGNVHWGYIPPDKLPSQQRGSVTHSRLCKHENFARTAKECCAFPTLEVKSTHSGEALVQDSEQFPPKQATVADVAGDLCQGFDAWAIEKRLSEERDDMGWFELTSMAQDSST